MSENWKIQVSPKLPDGTLVNIRAESAEEMTNLLNYAGSQAQLIADTAALLAGARNATAVTQPQAQQQQPQPAQQGGWNAGAAPYQAPGQPDGVIQFPQQGQQQQPQQGGVAGTKPGSNSQAPGPSPVTCEHGPYIWNDFVSRNNNNVKGYFCPANFRTQCKPEFRK